jgi:outer membrane protein assembly factor BamB
MDLIVGAWCRKAARALPLAAAVVAVAIAGGIATPAHAQVAVATISADDAALDDQANAPKGFAVLKADSKIVEMFEDFNRYSGKRSWELALHALSSIDEASSAGLVPAGDGFLVPIRTRVEECLLRLPPEGREAYRLFNDANARQLWGHLQDARGIPSDELETLRKLVERYFLTSVGDLAADRLGDALFEQGDFSGAERLWRLVVEKYPDSQLSLAKLQLKRCAALSQLGRRDAVSTIAAQVREKYADQPVTIGGREVTAIEFAESLIARAPPKHQSVAKDGEEVILPTADEPAWQIRIAGANVSGMIDPQTGMPLNASSFRVASSGAVDEKRFYANWLGAVYAADLETGKMLWRTDKFTDAFQRVTASLQQGILPDGFFLVAAGPKLLAGRRGSRTLLGAFVGGSPADDVLYLDCLDASSGKSIWSNRQLEETIVSAPYVVGDVAYVAGIAANNTTMNLLSISLATGQLQWRVPLGTPQSSRNWRGGVNFGGPNMLAVGDVLYVATNNGALLAVDLASHQVKWALQHDTKPAMDNRRMFWGNGGMTALTETSGALLDEDGVLYLKDSSARLLYAIDPLAPAVQWKRPISADESVATINEQTAYLLGHELSALDLKSRNLVWSTRLPDENRSLRPLICPEHIFVSTARGIFDIDPANGDIRRVLRGADHESRVCQLVLAGDKLIAIGDTTVTAYPIQRAKVVKLGRRPTE